MTDIEHEATASHGGPTAANHPVTESAPPPAHQPPAGADKSGKKWPGWLGAEELAFIGLLLLAIGGMAVADYSASSGLTYWMWVIPLFAVVSVGNGWRRARERSGKSVGAVLIDQLLHWGALLLAVYLIYLLEQTGRLNREDAGLVALLALSLTTVLAGIHFDRRLAILGALLAVGTACAALVEEFFWMLLLPALAAGAIVIVWRRLKSRGRVHPPGTS